jgi:hypothetical protein
MERYYRIAFSRWGACRSRPLFRRLSGKSRERYWAELRYGQRKKGCCTCHVLGQTTSSQRRIVARNCLRCFQAAHGEKTPPCRPEGQQTIVPTFGANPEIAIHNDPRPSGYTWRHQTLSNLMKLGRNLRTWCEDCGHEVIQSPVFFAMCGGLPCDTTVWEVAQKLTCRKCDSKRVGVEPKS